MMLGEIDGDFYCSGAAEKCIHYPDCKAINFLCESYHRKWPTPEQFGEEYGFDVPDDMPIYTSAFNAAGWNYNVWFADKKPYLAGLTVIVACTPFPMPDRDWRPE